MHCVVFEVCWGEEGQLEREVSLVLGMGLNLVGVFVRYSSAVVSSNSISSFSVLKSLKSHCIERLRLFSFESDLLISGLCILIMCVLKTVAELD